MSEDYEDIQNEEIADQVGDALEDAVSSANRIASKKNIAIKAVSPIMPVIMDMDYGRIRQMFLIVLDNAVKFSPADGEIDAYRRIIAQNRSATHWNGVPIKPNGQILHQQNVRLDKAMMLLIQEK